MNASDLEKPVLLVDAAGPLVQTGLWRNGEWLRWIGSREEAGRSLFAGVAKILRDETVALPDLGGFFFCAGPGSMLGIRMAAMAIRGWQSLLPEPLPVFSYQSHEMLARQLLIRPIAPPFHVISDARRQRWNVTSVTSSGHLEPLRRLPTEDLPELTGPCYRMDEIARSEPPVPVKEMVAYRLETHADLFLAAGLLEKSDSADPLVMEAPEYQKWSAERHR